MNKIRLTIILTLFAALCGTAYGQVTIGSNNPPNNGALLDLNDQKPDATDNTTAKKGMMLPRVNLLKLKPESGSIDLKKTIEGATGDDWDLNAHIGLTVYNVKAPDQCASDPIPTGVFTWTGTEWVHLGQSLALGVFEFTDVRDQEKYLGGNFGTAGDWMLENLRFIPKDQPDYPDYIESAASVVLPFTTKYYAFPGPDGPYDPATAEGKWAKQTGLLYNWPAALNVEDVNSSPLTIPNPGEVNQGAMYDDNTASPVFGVCPPGWHIPSDKEWNELATVIKNNYSVYSSGSPLEVGQAMKSPCRLPDVTRDTNGLSNTVRNHGFSSQLVGMGNVDFLFGWGQDASYWTSSSLDRSAAWCRKLYYFDPDIHPDFYPRDSLYSVRCKKD